MIPLSTELYEYYMVRAKAWFEFNEISDLYDKLDDKLWAEKDEVLNNPMFEEYDRLEDIPQSQIDALKINMLAIIVKLDPTVLKQMLEMREDYEKMLVKTLDIN